jgi:hypothetical protein
MNLHPWLCTPEAVEAAEAAVWNVSNMKLATGFEFDDLMSEALAILTDCALPPRSARWHSVSLASPGVALGHLGAMHTWPVDRRQELARREIKLRLQQFMAMRKARESEVQESVREFTDGLMALRAG